MQSLTDAVKQPTPGALERHIRSGAQPELSLAILGQLLRLVGTMPRKSRPSPEQQAVMSAALRAVIDELDQAHRTR